jgi:hypothetical protein
MCVATSSTYHTTAKVNGGQTDKLWNYCKKKRPNKDLLQITGFLFMKCFGIHFTIGSSITTHGLFKTKEECNILVKSMKSQKQTDFFLQ